MQHLLEKNISPLAKKVTHFLQSRQRCWSCIQMIIGSKVSMCVWFSGFMRGNTSSFCLTADGISFYRSRANENRNFSASSSRTNAPQFCTTPPAHAALKARGWKPDFAFPPDERWQSPELETNWWSEKFRRNHPQEKDDWHVIKQVSSSLCVCGLTLSLDFASCERSFIFISTYDLHIAGVKRGHTSESCSTPVIWQAISGQVMGVPPPSIMAKWTYCFKHWGEKNDKAALDWTLNKKGENHAPQCTTHVPSLGKTDDRILSSE